MQELATRVAHRNTGQHLTDPVGVALMNRVAADENLHFLFYRDLVSAALEIDPSATVCAIERQVRTFEMPGTGIIDFGTHAAAIARSGIYDLQVHHDDGAHANGAAPVAPGRARGPRRRGRAGPRPGPPAHRSHRAGRSSGCPAPRRAARGCARRLSRPDPGLRARAT